MGRPGGRRRAAPAQRVTPKRNPSSLKACGFPPVAGPDARILLLDTLATVMDFSAGLKDACSRVTFELALLQTELEGRTNHVATAVKRLSAMDATMMSAVAALDLETTDGLE